MVGNEYPPAKAVAIMPVVGATVCSIYFFSAVAMFGIADIFWEGIDRIDLRDTIIAGLVTRRHRTGVRRLRDANYL